MLAVNVRKMMACSDTRQVPRRRLPIGAEVQPGGGAHFRVWAPRRKNVEVVFPEARGAAVASSIVLSPEARGYFSGISPDAAAGANYGFRLDDEATLYPDPASRWQPNGPHGLSEVIDPAAYQWHDGDWPGVTLQGQVLYEMHVGTFTKEGT